MMRTRIAVLGLLAAFAVGPAWAQQAEQEAAPAPSAPPPPPESDATPSPAPVPVPVPALGPSSIATARVSFLSGFPDAIGASVTVTALRPVEVELGASTFIFLLTSVYARAGVAIPLVDARAGRGSGWTLHLPVLAGYRRMDSTLSGSVFTHEIYSGLNAVAGLDATYWIAPHLGIDFALVGGIDWWLYKNVQSDVYVTGDGRLTLGIAF